MPLFFIIRGVFMFNVKTETITSQTNELLYNIWQELIKLNNSLSSDTKEEKDYSNLKRQELIALVKKLPNKPELWPRLSNDKLIKLLKEGV